MAQQPIPISSARTFLPFVDFMIEIGAPVERWLEQHHLPLHIHEDPDSFVPTLNYWEFVSFSSRKEGVEDLGLRIGQDLAYGALGHRVFAGSYSAPTLLTGIKQFSELVRGEYSGSRVWLSKTDDGSVNLNLGKSFELGTPGYCQTEWIGLVVLVKLVRLFAGRTWQPDEIALRSHRNLPPLANGLYPDTHFRMAQPLSYIAFSKDLLSLGPCADGAEVVAKLEPSTGGWPTHDPPADFPASLHRLLMNYLRDGYPSVDFAAEIAGVSTRTLQRRLSAANLTYSRLVDRARFKLATHRLTDTDASSLEIAYETGYEDPSNFARAFRRLAGCSPREYRRRHSADDY
jgi:AraC-like DNA-binding protein